MPTKSEREVLKAVYRAVRDGGQALTGGLAEDVGVSPGSVTAVVKKLADRGLVHHRPYRGAELTPEGQREALAAIRRHRIVERFLADMLGYDWRDASRLASTFEHDLPQEIEDRLYVALNRPGTCPHGFPIPDREALDLPATPPLYALEPGDRALVAVPGSTDSAVVEFLDTLGLQPGIEVEVVEKHPFDGPLVVRVDGTDRTLSKLVADQVFVQPPEAVA